MFNTSMFDCCFLVADAAPMPAGKALAGLMLFGSFAVVSAIGVFASNTTLLEMSGIIGTNNPRAARAICALGLIVFGFASVFSFACLFGLL